MQIYLGSDHAGFQLKEKIKKHLQAVDFGNFIYDSDDDYPIYAARVGKAVVKSNGRGILFCGSAEGMCIAANKIAGVRAVAPGSVEAAKLSRLHNDANVLCIAGGRIKEKSKIGFSYKKAKQIIDAWLNTPFSNEARHKRRIYEISQLEK